MEPYCNFDAAAENVRELLYDELAELYWDMPRREIETVVDIAWRDFLHYLSYKSGIYLSPRFREDRARQRLCVYIMSKWDKVRELASEWIVMWSAKWRQRVKLVFSDEEFKRASASEDSLKPHKKLDEFLAKTDHLELQLFTVSNLVKAGELAGLDQIADYIIRDEANALLHQYGLEKALEKYREGVLAERILRRIKSLSKVSEPLLIIRVDVTRA
ncbi:hypothetical protein [Thermoproteus tenax]|uniref:Uncharacterized protein n=1 Tax=Thermoproteus tenax (strain ATCC 35583 / DSM 2078 / JCM 9277 / NBRC 100435 / Kra 1) TaxID=768679 RepID=G4RMC4_THETK|nr:hypothetical protein [Thermoproteus tenax]CCC80755.1 hypothetical protein TTX_0080 [Thermoproteus tenax Kra 1]